MVKRYGDVAAVDHVDLEIRPRELFTLLGPSGSGKTTVLRLIAGLVQASAGELEIAGRDVRGRPTYERDIGMVFQSLALFPHTDVFGNVAFPLRMRRVPRAEIERRVRASLDLVRLPNIASRRAHELSGGQQQRVALARALVYDPQLLLLDEPFGALDRRLREEMQLELLRLHGEIDVTIVNVTHDQREALLLSDRIGVMRDGRLEQVAPSEELYRRPATRFVAEFLGNANVIAGTAEEGGVRTEGGARIAAGDVLATGTRVVAVVRAEDVLLQGGQGAGSGLAGSVRLRAFEGEAFYYEIEIAGLAQPLKATSRDGSFDVGDDVFVAWEGAHVRVLADA